MNRRRSATIAFALSVIALGALAGVSLSYGSFQFGSRDQVTAAFSRSGVEREPAGARLLETYTGRLGPYHQVFDACSYYDLFDCDGSKIFSLSEGSYGSLQGYVGSWVSVDVTTAVCGSGIAGQPLYGPVVTGIRTITNPCSGYYEGRLGPYHQVADGCSYYPLLDCAGAEEVQLSEGDFGDLVPYVGQYVGVTTVISECDSGIAGQPLYGPVVTQLSVLSNVCSSATPTASPTPTATQTPIVMCTPPPCRPDEVYYCPGTCPGGCGTGCATVTPGPTETATPTATATSTPHQLYLPFIAQRSSGEGFKYESSECLNSSDRGEAEQVEIRVEGRDVVMEHRGVVYNCCATMVIDLIDQRPRLQLVERETYSESGPCRCVCAYDLKAWIRNLPAGTYDVEVWDERRTHLLGSAQVTIQ